MVAIVAGGEESGVGHNKMKRFRCRSVTWDCLRLYGSGMGKV